MFELKQKASASFGAILCYLIPLTAAAQQSPTLEEVIVLGQKRALDIREVTSSVAVWTPSVLNDLTVTSLSELYQITPNVNMTSDTEGEFSIRGINYRGIGFAGVANAASLYIDGVFQPNLGIEGGAAGVWDIDQVEVYRGPQSTVQGRNSLAGAIFQKTADPTYSWDAKARVEAADFNTQRVSGALGGPILEETLAFRVAADKFDTDGFVENPALGIDDVALDDSLTARAKLLFEPTDTLSTLLHYVYTEGNASTGLGTGAVEGPDFEQREVTSLNQTEQDIETSTWGLQLNWRLNEQLSLQWVSSYIDAEEDSAPRFEVAPGSPIDTGFDREEVTTTELRAMFDTDRWSLIGGLYYFEQEREFARDLSFPAINFSSVSGGEVSIENYAAYFDGEFALSDQLSLLFGGRLDYEEYREVSTNNGSSLNADTDFDVFLPKLGLRYDLDAQQTLGFTAQQGYRSGGAGLSSSGLAFDFGAENLWNYELSYRSTWLEGALFLNANLFYMDWSDQQLILGVFPDTVVDNAGESELYGFEADLNWAVSEEWYLFAAVGINSTEIKDLGGLDESLEGNEFPQSPGYQIAGGVTYSGASGVFGSLHVNFTDDAYSDTENLDENTLDAYTVVNAKLGYRADQWSVAAFARNLLDEDYSLSVNVNDPRGAPTGGGLAILGPPRVIGIELTLAVNP